MKLSFLARLLKRKSLLYWRGRSSRHWLRRRRRLRHRVRARVRVRGWVRVRVRVRGWVRVRHTPIILILFRQAIIRGRVWGWGRVWVWVWVWGWGLLMRV